MGDLYVVMPLDVDDALPAWLAEFGIAMPGPGVASRYPTPNEIRAVLDALPGCRVTYDVGDGRWDARIVEDGPSGGAHATVWVRDYHGDDDRPHAMSFHKGWSELNLAILRALTAVTGPLVYVSASTGTPILVTADMDVAEPSASLGAQRRDGIDRAGAARGDPDRERRDDEHHRRDRDAEQG